MLFRAKLKELARAVLRGKNCVFVSEQCSRIFVFRTGVFACPALFGPSNALGSDACYVQFGSQGNALWLVWDMLSEQGSRTICVLDRCFPVSERSWFECCFKSKNCYLHFLEARAMLNGLAHQFTGSNY